jgi:hypothetical protein
MTMNEQDDSAFTEAELEIVRRVEEAARVEGREADFAEVLYEIALAAEANTATDADAESNLKILPPSNERKTLDFRPVKSCLGL